MYELYLAHHGILGQRWGVRRYQNKDGSLTGAGQKRYDGKARHKPSSARKLAKQRAAALEKARKVRAEKAEFEKAKQKALTSGNATDVLKFQGHLTEQEMRTAYNRISLERQLNEVSAKEKAAGKITVDKVIDFVSKNADRMQKIGKVVKIVKDHFDAEEKKVKDAKTEEDRAKRAKELKDLISNGTLTPDNANKYIENKYFSLDEVKGYAQTLRNAKSKKDAEERAKAKTEQAKVKIEQAKAKASDAKTLSKINVMKSAMISGLIPYETFTKYANNDYLSVADVSAYVRKVEKEHIEEEKNRRSNSK